MAALGFQPHVIERVLNHVSGAQGGLVGVYQRHEYREERRRAAIAWGAQALEIGERGSACSRVNSLCRCVWLERQDREIWCRGAPSPEYT